MEPLRNLLIKELTSELHAQRWELTHRRLARFGEKGPLILLDPKLYQRKEDLDGEKAVSNVKDLGALLSSIEPHNEMGLLKLMGWYEVAHKAQLYHVFYAPPGCTAEYSIVTLHDYLGEAFRPSLTERVGLAHSLSQKVKYIHEHGYYHKGITNDNVVFFRHASEARSLTRSYLTGFDFSRKAEMGTWSEKPLSTHTCMFLHPDALQNPDVCFSPKYDYYALGVLFIEIVLWQRIEDVLCKHQSLQKKICLPQDALKIRGILLNEPADQDENYLREVAFQAGDRYSEVVELCLTGAFGRSLSEKALVAAFDKRVVHQLQSCVI